jgi:TatA/E family protein of Tat protein translocase
VFGVGVQEMVVIGLLFLIIFGPSKLPQMARDLGQFVDEARRAVDGFKEDLILAEEDRRKPEEGGELEREEAFEVVRSERLTEERSRGADRTRRYEDLTEEAMTSDQRGFELPGQEQRKGRLFEPTEISDT